MIDVLQPLIKQFMPFAQERMGFKRPPKLFLKQDRENSANPLGKTAFYDSAEMAVTLYVTDRHPKDVMRSLSHELVHHSQNCDGKFKDVGEMGEGYAQNNDHLREMERQAYELGNMCFRDWEDSIKGTIYNESLQKGANENMSTKKWKDNELKTLLTEQWGFKMDLSQLSERKADDWGKNPAAFTGTEEEEEEEVEDVEHEKGLEESELFEQATTICKQRHEIQGDKAVRACIEEKMMKHNSRSGQSELEESWADAPEEEPGGAWYQGRGGGWTSETHPGGGKRYSGGGSSTEQKCKDMGCPGTHDTWWQNPERIKAAMPDCDIDMCNPDALRENAGDLYEKHARDWGDKAGDEGSEATDHEHDTDYSGHGMRAGDESDTHPGKDFEHHDTKEGSDEDPKDLAGELLDLAHRFGSAVGVESDVSDDDDEMMDIEVEEEEELEEISKRKDDPRNARAKEWPDRMREALKRQNVKLTEAQTKAIIQRATKIYRNRKR